MAGRLRAAPVKALADGEPGGLVRSAAEVLERLPLKVGVRTKAMSVVVAVGTGAAIVGELAHVWRRGSAPLPSQTGDVLGAAAVAAHETRLVVAAGYRHATIRETSLLVLLSSFSIAFTGARLSTWMIRRRGRFGPFRDLALGDAHVHHYVPGIILTLLAGAASVLSENQRLDPWLAVPFGVGAALTLDEAALLLELDDVYWSEEGVVSVQLGLVTMGALSALTLARRLLRRGEAEVLREG